MKLKKVLVTLFAVVVLGTIAGGFFVDKDNPKDEASTTTKNTTTTSSIEKEETTSETTVVEISENSVTSSTKEEPISLTVTKTTTTVASTTGKTVSTSKTTVKNINQPTYIKGIMVVNKTYSLPSTYAPGVDSTAKKAFDELAADAKKEDIDLYIRSGYRSYDYQKNLYNNYVSRDGQKAADTYSARPGHSEHQTGLAFDINSLSTSWGETKEGKWLANNCWKYGFIIRYPKGKESITGYQYEPWHIRYLGKSTAKSVYDSGKCLEEYLGITSEYSD